MEEIEQIVSAFEALCAEGKAAAVATVAAVEGSGYRRPGARMLVAADGRAWGAISGGCLDRDVARRARLVIDTGRPDVCCYESPHNPDEGENTEPGATLGCGGRVDVFIEKVERDSPGILAVLADAFHRRRSACVGTVVRGGSVDEVQRLIQTQGGEPSGNVSDSLIRARILDEFSRLTGAAHLVQVKTESDGIIDILIERIFAPLEVVIFGDGRDVAPLEEFARLLGWRVKIIGRSDDPPVEISDESAAVVMGHDYRRDLAAVRHLLKRPPMYVGILGPRHRTRRLLKASGADWERPEISQRLFWPIGLDVGAQSPQQIALAIVAEIQAVMARRNGGHLRQRAGPIHDFEAHEMKVGRSWT
jgi:xanthine dehydrogenase accessory factor